MCVGCGNVMQEWFKAQNKTFKFHRIIKFVGGWVKCSKYREDYFDKIKYASLKILFFFRKNISFELRSVK
jgi:hypothetical protein